MDGARPDCP
jgi:hypothetical protein